MPDSEKLQNLGEEAAPVLAQTLTSLLGRDALVTFSQVASTDGGAFSADLEGDYVSSTLRGSGGLDGTAYLLTKEKDSAVIADLLIGQDGTAAPEKMTELHLSAFGEVIHQLADNFSQALKKAAGSKAALEVKESKALDPALLGQQLSKM